MVNLKIIIAIIIGVIIGGVIIGGVIIGGVIEFNAEREGAPWRAASGPFQIEKYEYYLGEKIFFNAVNVPVGVNGEIIFFKPAKDGINKYPKQLDGVPPETISKKVKYLEIKYDGKSKQNFNQFFEPRLNEWKGICDRNDLVGEWVIIFSGTQYEPIHFTVLNYSMPSDPRSFEPLVGIGKC